jgi:hypothetical protein
VGPRAGVDDVKKRKFLTLPGLELRPLSLPAQGHADAEWIQIAQESSVAGSCTRQCISGSIKEGEFLDWLSDYYLLKKGSTPRRNYVHWDGCRNKCQTKTDHLIKKQQPLAPLNFSRGKIPQNQSLKCGLQLSN